MKKKLTFLIGILFISAQAQNKHFDLVWNDTPTQFSTEDSSIKLPTFTKEYFVYNDDATISFVAQWNDDRSVNKNSIRIENVAYGTLSNENLGGIDKRKLPTTIKSEILNSSARGKNAHVLVVSPLINENGVVKKVLSFDVSYNFLARRPNSIFKSRSNYQFRISKWKLLQIFGARIRDFQDRRKFPKPNWYKYRQSESEKIKNLWKWRTHDSSFKLLERTF